ncbi:MULTISPECIES: organic hydroperoxide resistance protein [Polyangium]|uniref:Organic hydroperoxide resistance protein n=2 Tax=Polyangium TaxID=55 RepID=A0A4U1IEI6_9BACT|nr:MULTISPECIES: organic hydroperoxide resistance protein [Polyangium]MDI1433699.1 organic hydroperoxide resistance protein [Polyangium sorediatum]TKC92103.1 organic hydroperoxide resistance protein [Polyangium fumosum]
MKILYTTGATATNGREGHVKTEDGKFDLQLSLPKSVGGPGGDGTNPEQLFSMGYSACFGGALALVARMQKVQTGPVQIEAKVSLGQDASGGFGLAVELIGHIPNLPREQAEALMHAAHQVCPYSKATRGNIEVKLSVA